MRLHTCTQGSLLAVLQGHTHVPGGSRSLASRPFCQGGFGDTPVVVSWGAAGAGRTSAPVLKVPVFTLGRAALISHLNLTDFL